MLKRCRIDGAWISVKSKLFGELPNLRLKNMVYLSKKINECE